MLGRDSMPANLKSIASFQVLTQDGVPGMSHGDLARLACQGGARWIQLRAKNLPVREWLIEARAVAKVCRAFDATFIINDNPDIARQAGADGVHLGQVDLPVSEARRQLGPGRIIGGTANTIEQARRHFADGADYVGGGPFRFTTTKKGLAPVLGMEGLRALAAEFPGRPLVAIGGIRLDDVEELLKAGLHGVAVSAAVNLSASPEGAARAFLQIIDETRRRLQRTAVRAERNT